MTHQTQKEHNKKEMVYHLHLTKCELIETNCELTRTKAKLNDKLDETVQELSRTTMDLKVQFIDRINPFETLLQLHWSYQLYSTTETGNEVIPITCRLFNEDEIHGTLEKHSILHKHKGIQNVLKSRCWWEWNAQIHTLLNVVSMMTLPVGH